jgi:DNA-binding response OmpR family regulator
MRVLLVEDDDQMADLLQAGLRGDGFAVDRVSAGDDALAAVDEIDYDVISLDVMIPRGDGFAVCRELRRRRVPTPVLMLTARDAVEDRVRGLESGADDYLAKPFAFVEFVARLRALARRHLPARAAVLEAGPIRLDTSAHVAHAGGSALELTAKEFAILEHFLLNQGLLLSREQVLEAVWGYDAGGDSNLVDVYVARLRRKLAAAGVADPFTTVRNAGYRFEVE